MAVVLVVPKKEGDSLFRYVTLRAASRHRAKSKNITNSMASRAYQALGQVFKASYPIEYRCEMP